MKRPILKTLLALSLALTGAKSYAQVGMNINANSGINISGYSGNGLNDTHYLFNEWHKGSVKLLNNTVYNDLDLMYDQTNDRVIFLADSKLPQLFQEPVREFVIKTTLDNTAKYRSGYPKIAGKKPNGFYNVLVDGKAQFLKDTKWKIVMETTGANIYATKQLKEVESYYLYANGKVTAFRNNRKSVVQALSDQSALIDKYLTQNNVDLTTENGIAAVVKYYNSL